MKRTISYMLQSQKTSESLRINWPGSISGGQTSTARIKLAGRGEINPRANCMLRGRSPVRCATRTNNQSLQRYINRQRCLFFSIVSLNSCKSYSNDTRNRRVLLYRNFYRATVQQKLPFSPDDTVLRNCVLFNMFTI